MTSEQSPLDKTIYEIIQYYKYAFIPYFNIVIDGDRHNTFEYYAIDEEESMIERVEYIYNNIKDFKGKSIEILYITGHDSEEIISVIETECDEEEDEEMKQLEKELNILFKKLGSLIFVVEIE